MNNKEKIKREILNKIPNSTQIEDWDLDTGTGVRFSLNKKRFRVSSTNFVEEISSLGLIKSNDANKLEQLLKKQ